MKTTIQCRTVTGKKNSCQVRINQLNTDIVALKRKINDHRLTQTHISKHVRESLEEAERRQLKTQRAKEKADLHGELTRRPE